MSARHQLRRKRLRGNVLLEFALTWLPIMLLLFGLADVSRMIFMRTMMQNAVREGVRYALTYRPELDGQPCGPQSGCIKRVVQRNTLGFLTGAVGGRDASSFIQVSYYTPDKLWAPATRADLPKNVDGVVIRHLNQPGNLVEVRVDGYPVNWMLPLPAGYLAESGFALSVAASDVLPNLPPGQEAPPEP